jgi:glucans biosynthesis protein
MRTPDDSIGFVIDFTGPALKKLPPDAQVEGAVSLDANAERVQDFTYRNPITQGWRTVLRVRRIDPAKPVELRLVLRSGGNPVSEIWSYIIPPG